MAVINGSFAKKEDTMMDMGYVSNTAEPIYNETVEGERTYPTLYLDNVPEGLFATIDVGESVYFSGKGMLKRISKEQEDKKDETCIVLEIHAMQPLKTGE